jgi:FtsZ-binding cell division protein ZapB
MSLGLQETRNRRRRARRWALLKWMLILAALGAAFYFAYETARQLARIEVERLEDRVAELEAELDEAAEEKSQLRAELEEARQSLQDWKERYQAEVPEGETARILSQVRARLDNGVPADRLAFVVNNASPHRSCDRGPVTKRFIVQTPLSTGAGGSVSFADGRITVTARGDSASNAQGQPEAWYDPATPVEATFARIGGADETVEGTLPIHHSVVIGDHEHRFTMTESESRAFALVTWERCDYP